MMINKQCSVCKKPFTVHNYRKDSAIFCSRKCKGIARSEKAANSKRLFFGEGLKRCSKCKEIKSLKLFYKSTQKRDGYDSWCRKCKLMENLKYAKNPEVAARKREWRMKYNITTRDLRRINRIKHLYGLTFEEYEKIFSEQGGNCKICGDKLNRDKNSHIDHCHKSKRVRGILCSRCNAGLGNFRDNLENILNAIKYINPNYLEVLCKECHAKLHKEGSN